MQKQFKFLLILIISSALIAPVWAKQPLVTGLPDFTQLVEHTASSVVKITTTKRRVTRSNREEELLRYFFGDQIPKQPQQEEIVPSGVGSGFIVSEDGFILTNDHVAADAEEIKVRLNDGRVFIAQLIGSDSQSDVAVLKIDATGLPALDVGNSDHLKVGEWVLAIGSPFEFDYSVTAGIVSAKGRSLPGSESFVPFIQTDVAINPGNSGGPLFNMYGEVVGINSQIYSRSGGFMGLSFAIPINVAINVMEQLKDGGEVQRGWLGILMEPSFNDDPQLAKSLGAINNNGALVKQVGIDSPAAKAGIKAGDIITHVNGEPIARFNNLAPMIASVKPGTQVDVTVYRNSKSQVLKVVLGSQNNMELGMSSNAQAPNLVGIDVRELTKTERKNLSNNEQGVVVDKVLSDIAIKEGVEQGDIITMIGGVDVSNVKQFNDVAAKFEKNQRIALRIIRGPEIFFVVLKL